MKIIGTENEIVELLESMPKSVGFESPMWCRNLIEWNQQNGNKIKFHGYDVTIEFIDNYKKES